MSEARAVTQRQSRLLEPLKVRGVLLPNRVVMGAMHTRIEALDRPTERIHAFYRDRAEGEVGMIITGGVAPNPEGRVELGAPYMSLDPDVDWHKSIVRATAGTLTLMCLQILHTGRYARFEGCVAPSAIKSRISRHVPRALTTREVWRTIDDYARTAAMARDLGYHAVEIMGSEGYLINQFTAEITNQRDDEFGGSFEGRIRFPLEILKAVRSRVGDDYPIVYRISVLDLVRGGMSGDETFVLARRLRAAGADVINTGFGWHELTVPTIAHVVPRAAWGYAARKLKEVVDLPVIASNRINQAQVAEDLLASGAADLVSMARPLLADPDFVRKVRLGRAREINTCIACNQACLDHVFKGDSASCLVNPRAGHELEFPETKVRRAKRIAVVGAGAAGMAFAFNAQERGHAVTLFEASERPGGQLLMARNIPEKTEFDELLRHFLLRLRGSGVDLRAGDRVTAHDLLNEEFDEVVLATGVRPRWPAIPGIKHPKVLGYTDVLLRRASVGRRVAIVGAGGIAFDTAEFLVGGLAHVPPALPQFAAEYGLDLSVAAPGGLIATNRHHPPLHEITLLQRSPGRVGSRLAPSTGWIRRDKLARQNVSTLSGVEYLGIDDAGLHIRVEGKERLLEIDNVIVCAGQEPDRRLFDDLHEAKPDFRAHLVGGADVAAELDAARAIDQATRLAMVV